MQGRDCDSGVYFLVNENRGAGQQPVHLFKFRIAHGDQHMVLQLFINLQEESRKSREGSVSASVFPAPRPHPLCLGQIIHLACEFRLSIQGTPRYA